MKIFSTLFTFRAQATPVVKLLAMDLAQVGQDPPDPQVADCWPAVGNMPVPLYLKHSHPWVAKGSLPSTEVSAGAIVSGLLLVCFDVITQCQFQLLSNTNLVQQS